MDSTEESSVGWLSLVREAFIQTDGSPRAVSAAIGARCAGLSAEGRRATAFAESVVELAAYAQGGLAEDVTAVDAEAEAITVSRCIVRPLLEANMQDALDNQAVGQAVCPECGRTAESQGRRTRTWGSIVGPLHLKRRYASCQNCRQGFAPAQKALGLTFSDFTPRLEEVTTMMATTVPYGMAAALVG